MDQIRQQKFQQFLGQKDREIKEMNDYSALERGDQLLGEIEQFEEENAEFLQQNGELQDELNKRKFTINFILFPIISDDKVLELLQYHLLEALESNLDIEFLMKERAITTSELLWPKLAQEYIKALSQNTELIGSEPLISDEGKNTYLPYIKNWIGLYNRRFGIEKHSGLEIHQFLLENPNTRKLLNHEKEYLIKVLSFYENLKVYSLSEIEAEMRKISQEMAKNFDKTNLNQKTVKEDPTSTPQLRKNIQTNGTNDDFLFPGDKIKFKTEPISASQETKPTERILVKKIVEETVSDQTTNKSVPDKIERGSILELMEKYPEIKNQKITNNSITLRVAPFSVTPTLSNWVNHYFNECGKGRHRKEDREGFIELLKKNQNLSPDELKLISLIFLSLDEKILLSLNLQTKLIVIDNIGVGDALKESTQKEIETSENNLIQKSPILEKERNNNYKSDDLQIELIPNRDNNNQTFNS